MGDVRSEDATSNENQITSQTFPVEDPIVNNNNSPKAENVLKNESSEQVTHDKNNLIGSETRKISADKRVRFSEKVENVDKSEETFVKNDLSLQSAVSRETKVVWEMIAEGQKEAVKSPHKDSIASTDSVFVHDQPEENISDGKMVTDLDDDDDLNELVKGGNVFRSLLEDRKQEKVTTSEFLGDGGYVSLEAAGGGGVGAAAAGGVAAPHSPHSCGSLFAQCGAHRGQGHSLVTTFSHGRLRHVEPEDTYSGPVSLTEILHERDGRMCRPELSLMGNGVSNLGKGERSPEGAVSPGAGAGAGMVALLRKEIKQWEERSTELGEEVAELRKEVKRKDHEILRLQREVHKLKVTSFTVRSTLIISLNGFLFNYVQENIIYPL